jgi:hypothetical protein
MKAFLRALTSTYFSDYVVAVELHGGDKDLLLLDSKGQYI